jgi:hypothetical protein
MTTKVITGGTIAGSYTLSAAYAALSVTSTGAIEAYNGGDVGFFYNGDAGGVALTLPFAATAANAGKIEGGAGGQGGFYSPLGGAGGVGAVFVGGGAMTNAGSISGGAGGIGGGTSKGGAGEGGAGAAGVTSGAALSLTNSGMISGGAGGTGGFGFDSGNAGGAGGAGGVGVFLVGASHVLNKAMIAGGAGGAGGTTNFGGVGDGFGGAGGAGLRAGAGASVTNQGSIMGANGGVGGGGDTISGAGGAAGVGVALGAGGVLVNSGVIDGGIGGTGGYGYKSGVGSQGGAGGAGGAGVDLTAGGTITNTGSIFGGAGGAGGAGEEGDQNGPGGPSADGAVLAAGGVVVNGGSSSSAAEITGFIGVYAAPAAAATIINYGLITGSGPYSVWLRSTSDRLIAKSGSSFDGQIMGGGGTLELGPATGTIADLGSQVTLTGGVSAMATEFRAYQIDAGGTWTLLSSTNLGFRTLINDGLLTNAGYVPSYGSIINAGTILDDGTLRSNGVMENSGSILDAATFAAGGYVDNAGVISGAAGLYDPVGPGFAGPAGVTLTGSGTMVSSGHVTGGVGGGGGYLSMPYNGGYGGAGVILTGAAQSLVNNGVIAGGAGGPANPGPGAAFGGPGGAGVSMAGGAVVNSGQIVGGAGGTGFESGLGGDGISDAGPGTVTNGAAGNRTASIAGYVGIYADAYFAATVTNYGTIDGTGGTSVRFLNGGDRLIVEGGSDLIGVAKGGGGTLELAPGTGTVAGLGAVGTLSGAEAATFSGFSTYQLDAGTWTLNSDEALSSGQSLIVENGATAQVSGLLANAGTVALDSTTSDTELRVLAAGATLATDGKVTLSGAKSIISGTTATAILTNVDDTISGQGWLGLSKMVLVNETDGVIEAVGKQALVINTKGETSTNDGLIEASSGSTLALQDTTLDQSGGTLTALAGGRLDLEESLVSGGTAGSSGSGRIIVNENGSELEDLTLTGLVQVDNGVALTLVGAIDNTGKLDTSASTSATKLVIGPGGVSLTGSGEIDMTANADNIIVGAASSDVLTNVDNRIVGGGDIGDGAMVLVNDASGVIIGNASAALTINTGSHTVTNVGDIDSEGTGGVTVTGAVANTGLLYAVSGTLALEGAVSGAGKGEIDTGVLEIESTFGETVSFVSGATGQLKLTDWAGFTGAVKGFSTAGANTIDLAGFSLTGAKASFTGTTASGVLTVTNGTQTATIDLTGDYLASTFTVASDGHGGVVVKDPTAPAWPSASSLTQAIASFRDRTPASLTCPPAHPPPTVPLIHASG